MKLSTAKFSGRQVILQGLWRVNSPAATAYSLRVRPFLCVFTVRSCRFLYVSVCARTVNSTPYRTTESHSQLKKSFLQSLSVYVYRKSLRKDFQIFLKTKFSNLAPKIKRTTRFVLIFRALIFVHHNAGEELS